MLPVPPSPASFVNPVRAGIAALSLLVVAAGGYAFHEHNVAKRQVEQNAATASDLNATRDQVNALTARLDAMSAEQAAAKLSQPATLVYRRPLTAASSRHRIDDPRWKKFQGQMDDQAKQIDATRQDLASARTDLEGSIATSKEREENRRLSTALP